MTVGVHVTIDQNEGDIGYTAIWTAIKAALATLPIDIELRIDPVVRTGTHQHTAACATSRPCPDDATPWRDRAATNDRLIAIQQLVDQLKANPIPGPVGLSVQMLAARLGEILRGEI